MLKQRVITAVALAAGFIFLLFFSSWLVFAVAMAAVLLLAAWEWANLAGLDSLWARLSYLLAVSSIALGGAVLTEWSSNLVHLRFILVVACTWWAISLLWIQSFPSSSVIWGTKTARLVIGLLVLVPAWLAALYLRSEPLGAWLMFLVVLLVSAADIGAYFTGRAIGKRKLAPQVSPAKSWEGVFGGAVLAIIVAMGFNFALKQDAFAGSAWLSLLVIALATSLVSVVGDLLESMVKRYRGVKDSSQLLPGHGGVLDRIDGLVAAIPVFALAFMSTAWRL